MDPLHIVLIVLVLAGIWAVVEIALTVRRARSTVDSLDRTVGEMNEMLAEARPVVSKLDGAIDELQPALSKVEPLLSSANVAVDALSANLVEVEAVVRDVSTVTGAAASAGNAVSGVADSASEAVQRLFGKFKGESAATDRALTEPVPSEPAEHVERVEDIPSDPAPAPRYYTYDAPDADSALVSNPSTQKDASHE